VGTLAGTGTPARAAAVARVLARLFIMELV
jgi:hypothetical protein